MSCWIYGWCVDSDNLIFINNNLISNGVVIESWIGRFPIAKMKLILIFFIFSIFQTVPSSAVPDVEMRIKAIEKQMSKRILDLERELIFLKEKDRTFEWIRQHCASSTWRNNHTPRTLSEVAKNKRVDLFLRSSRFAACRYNQRWQKWY